MKLMSMREIKFRAWDKKRKTMWEVDCLNWYDEHMWVNESPMSGDKLPIGSTPIMQFTGLTDRHGVEIYEGDIILVIDAVSMEQSAHEVKWAGIGWNRQILFTQVEVIGNIYETPELLEANQ